MKQILSYHTNFEVDTSTILWHVSPEHRLVVSIPVIQENYAHHIYDAGISTRPIKIALYYRNPFIAHA